MSAYAAVPHGSPEQAKAYYHRIAGEIGFRDTKTILDSTLDDVLAYTGYDGLSANDLLRLPSHILMDPVVLGQPCTAPCQTVSDAKRFASAFAIRPLRPGDILASRFFAPKIINVNKPADTRDLGWRKLVRLRARSGSAALKQQIHTAIILFNFFTKPGQKPFGPDAESLNTQVMLLSTTKERDSIYWLDYDKVGKLSLKLDASFDATDLQAQDGNLPYFVPDGCNACHGEIAKRALINYLDTDHWFDRTENDLTRVKQEGVSVLFDAGTDDPASTAFARAFDVIRQFNEEAQRQAKNAQPKGFHHVAAETWLTLHEQSNDHVPPLRRAVHASWSTSATDKEALELLNQYCFRCHGSIRFNVFDKKAVTDRHTDIRARLKPAPDQLKIKMPPDRTLSPQEIERLLQILP